MIKTNKLPILREQDRFLNEVFSDFFGESDKWTKATRTMNCDVKEIDDHFIFSLDIPGVNKEDIKVEVKKGNLFVSAKRDNHLELKEGQYLKRERAYGEFRRSFSLSDEIDTESVDASYQDGVLHLVLAKKAEQKPNLIEVKSEKPAIIGG